MPNLSRWSEPADAGRSAPSPFGPRVAMSETPQSQVNEQLEAARELEAAMGLPSGFFEGLYVEDDDWSFIVKLHALATRLPVRWHSLSA
jgi:hypothetical protein